MKPSLQYFPVTLSHLSPESSVVLNIIYWPSISDETQASKDLYSFKVKALCGCCSYHWRGIEAIATKLKSGQKTREQNSASASVTQ